MHFIVLPFLFKELNKVKGFNENKVLHSGHLFEVLTRKLCYKGWLVQRYD